MVQLIAFVIVTAALVVLVLQNLTPVVSLVVLGRSVGALPFSLWLLGAIAIGVICALIIYQLVPQKRTYRPIGQRLSDPAPEPRRFVDAPSPDSPPASRFQPSDRQNPYDSDWETFKAPEQWDDWQQQPNQASGYAARDRPRPTVGEASGESMGESAGESVGDAVRDIESGWGDDDDETSARYASRQEPGPDIGWNEGGSTPYDPGYDSGADQPPARPRTYEGGWLYGNDSPEAAADPAAPGEPPNESEDDVYDANYRVIIPPYDVDDKAER